MCEKQLKILTCASRKIKAPDKVHIFISNMPIPSPNSMFDHSLESYHQDDSNKWSNIEFGEGIKVREGVK